MHVLLLALQLSAGGQLVVDATNSPFAIEFDTTVPSLLVETGGVLEINATLTVTGDAVIRGTVSHRRGSDGINLVVGGLLDVQTVGRIDVTGRGLLGGNQAGNGFSPRGQTVDPLDGLVVAGAGVGNGGSHGGRGATVSLANPAAPDAYGAQDAPVTLGGGGGGGDCGTAGGNGGGRMVIAAGTLRLDGVVTANGAPGVAGCTIRAAGGAGGSVRLTAGLWEGAGSITAQGGVGGGNGADGGGGRIQVTFTTRTYVGAISTLAPATGVAGAFGSTMLTSSLGDVTVQGGGLVCDAALNVSSLSLADSSTLLMRGPAQVASPLRVPAGSTLEIETSDALDNVTFVGDVGGIVRVHAPVTWPGGISIDGLLVLNARLDVAGDVAVNNAGRINHAPLDGDAIIAATGTVLVAAGGLIDVTGLGLPSGQSTDPLTRTVVTTPAGTGGNHAGAGGAAGALAGVGEGVGDVAGVVDARNPSTFGGGGGLGPCSEAGGAGGGAIAILGQTVRVDGAVRANGTAGVDGCGVGNGDSGGGAGGSILVQADVFTGTGSVTAAGAAGENEAGGGGGGRIAIYTTTNTFTGALSTAAGGPQSGGIGTVHIESPTGALTVQGGRLPIVTGDVWSSIALRPGSGGGPAGILDVDGAAAVGAPIVVTSTTTANVRAPDAFTALSFDLGAIAGTLRLDVPASLGPITVGGGGALVVNRALDVAGDVVVLSTGRITHDLGVEAFELDVTGTVDVRAGGRIEANGKGLRGGPTAGFATSGAALDPVTLAPTQGSGVRTGGVHAGIGAGPSPGVPYGDADAPDTLGGGGGAGPCSEQGGAGGGRIRVRAAVLNVAAGGEVRADGGAGRDGCSAGNGDSGGGAGGTVNVDVTELRGAGLISADGAVGENEGSGGGGGRVKLAFDTSTYTGVIRANGADGGSAGTISADSDFGGGLAVAGGARVIGAGDAFDFVVVGAGALLEIAGAASVTEPIVVASGATVVLSSPDALAQLSLAPAVAGTLRVDVDTDAIAAVPGSGSGAGLGGGASGSGDDTLVVSGTLVLNALLQVPAFELTSTGRVLHDVGARDAQLVVAGAAVVRSGGRFDVAARGLRGAPAAGFGAQGATIDPASGPVGVVIAGSGQHNGGSHVGLGGLDNPAAPLAQPYDSVDIPSLPGGGGGQGPCGEQGGNGGGVMRIAASSLTHDGVITADGGNGVDGCGTGANDSGAGAGGSVVISVGTLAGVGSITARGGTGENESGGGGGGAIALHFVSSTFTGTLNVDGGGPVFGGAGDAVQNRPNFVPQIVSNASGVAAVGVPWRYQALALGTAPLTWSLVDAPATGAPSIDAATGLLAWTPVDEATALFRIRVVNSAGADTQAFLVVPGGPPALLAPTITSTPSPNAYVGLPYFYDSDVRADADGSAPITWSTSGPLPPGFGIDPGTGFVSWTPDAVGPASACIVAANAAGSDEQCFSVVVELATAPVITSVPFIVARVGEPYSYDDDGAVSAQGAAPIGFAAVTSPATFSIDLVSGAVTWTPDAPGNVDIVLRADNLVGTDEQAFTVSVLPVGPDAAPVIVRSANGFAAPGVDYVYDDDGAASAGGDPPLLWSVVDGPVGFVVEPTTGIVSWRPSSAGTEPVTLRVDNAFGFDEYTFSVDVAAGVGGPPDVVVSVVPESGDAPLSVAVDASASRADDGSALVFFRWTFGDGAPPLFAASGVHEYAQPGSYVARLRVADALGAVGEATSIVSVLADGVVPPRARILISEVSGADELEVSLSCDCAAGDSDALSYLWDFGDGEQSALTAVTHTFGPGGYEVRLVVVDGNGLTASDSVFVSVADDENVPPLVVASAAPTFGRAPLDVQLFSTYADADGEVVSVAWELGDGATSSDANPTYTYATPGPYLARVVVTDAAGLSASASVAIEVQNEAGQRPPQILSLPTLTGALGAAYSYDEDGLPAARGDRPLTWSIGKLVGGTRVGAPEGASVDAVSGRITWTPTVPGDLPVTLVASNDAGAIAQDFIVSVSGTLPPPPPGEEGCACGAATTTAPAVPIALALLIVARVSRRRRCAG